MDFQSEGSAVYTQDLDPKNKENDQNKLPSWDLSDFYLSFEDPAMSEDLSGLEKDAITFQKEYEGTLARKGQLFGALQQYEKMSDQIGRVYAFAHLSHALKVSDPDVAQAVQEVRESVNKITARLLFFTLEINALEEQAFKNCFTEDSRLEFYAPFLDKTRLFQKHMLSRELETFLHEQSMSGRLSWVRLFDETMADLRISFEGKQFTSTEILGVMLDHDPQKRKEASLSFSRALEKEGKTLALLTNTLAKDKETKDRWRGYTHPVASRNLENFVEDEVVETLVDVVRGSYKDLSHRYYGLKAKWFGKDKLDFWDRNAPFPGAEPENYKWDYAQETVQKAYDSFSPEIGGLVKRFFENDWIDAAPFPGKNSGAFAHPTVPSAHPYILLNYQGKTRDIMTLAHELGHGVHQILANKQGPLMAPTPLTLAETASVFGEMLTFHSLMAQDMSRQQRRILLAQKIEDKLNTIVRQIAFHCFEKEVHQRRRSAELTYEDLCQIWMETQKEALGPAVSLPQEYKPFWSYVPHFIHVPFYVYAYAFGESVVNSLYMLYQEAEDKAVFVQNYISLLEAGGSQNYKDLLSPFGLNPKDKTFWTKGVLLITSMIDELEELS